MGGLLLTSGVGGVVVNKWGGCCCWGGRGGVKAKAGGKGRG